MTDVDPKAAARMATESHTDAEGIPAPDPAGIDHDPGIEPEDSGNSILDGLLETDPDSTPAEYPDMSEPAAHAMIGTVKFLNGVLGEDRDLGRGKPALINYIQSVLGFVSDTDGSDPEPSEPDRPSPAGGVGGEIPDE